MADVIAEGPAQFVGRERSRDVFEAVLCPECESQIPLRNFENGEAECRACHDVTVEANMTAVKET